jgi:hypothetical protein
MPRWIPIIAIITCTWGCAAAGSHEGGTSAGGSSGSGTGPDQRLLPLEVGRVWTYDLQSTYPSCPAGTRTFDVTGTATVPGKTAFSVTTPCGEMGTYTIDGDVVESQFSYSSGAWLRDLDEPVEEGHTWTTTNGAATFGMIYHAAPDAQTPAGQLSDCWQVVQQVSYTQDWVYCRGVGLVSSTLTDLSGGSIVYQLTAKSF